MEGNVEQKNVHVNPGFLSSHGPPKIHFNPAFLNKSRTFQHVQQEHKTSDPAPKGGVHSTRQRKLYETGTQSDQRQPVALGTTASKYINPNYLQKQQSSTRYTKNQFKSQCPPKSMESSYVGKYEGMSHAHTYPGFSYAKKHVESAYSKKYYDDSGSYKNPSDYSLTKKYLTPKYTVHSSMKKISPHYNQYKSEQFRLAQNSSLVNQRLLACRWSAAVQKSSSASQSSPSIVTQDRSYVKAVHSSDSPRPMTCNNSLPSASQQFASDGLLSLPPLKAKREKVEKSNCDNEGASTLMARNDFKTKISWNCEERVGTKDKTVTKRNSNNITIQNTDQKSTSTILVNPKVIKSFSKPESHDLVVKVMPGTESLFLLHSSGDRGRCKLGAASGKTLAGSKIKNDYKILSKTKLVRNKTDSVKTTKGMGTNDSISPGLEKTVTVKPEKSLALTKLNLPGLKGSPKKSYSTLSRTKLVRNHGSSSHSKPSTNPGKPKYSVNTKTKLVRRRSKSSSESQDKNVALKPELERHRKFSVLSKTKLVRRRSNSGVYKASLMAHASAAKSSQVIIRRHKLVRNGGTVSERYWFRRGLRKTHGKSFSKFIHNKMRLSSFRHFSKQKGVMKDSISKYKINRLKVAKGSSSVSKYKTNHLKPSPVSLVKRTSQSYRYSHGGKMHNVGVSKGKGNGNKLSDRFVSIGGILYKSTKTSLRLHQPQAKVRHPPKAKGSSCIVSLRGHKFQVSAKGRTLKRVSEDKQNSSPIALPCPTLSRVHIGGLTYSRTKTGQYELTHTHQTRALLSWARHRSMVTLVHRKKRGPVQKCNQYCMFFNRFGRCTKKDKGECLYVHDPKRVAICTRFLRGRCPVTSCPFSHTVDPERMPVCSHFLQASCSREDCPYRHVRVNPNAPICLDFVRGYCQAGQECKKQHILVCDEYSQTGKCPRGAQCPLSHHRKQARISWKYSSANQAESKRNSHNSQNRKRKKNENEDVLGQPKPKKKTQKKNKKSSSSAANRYFQHTDSIQDAIADITEEELFQCIENEKLLGDPHAHNIKKEVCDDSIHSCKFSGFEDTRKRLLLKIEKMKQSYTTDTDGTHESLGNKNISCKIKLEKASEQQQTEEGRKNEECGEMEVNDQQCVNGGGSRRPLLQKLPSYIPLSMTDVPEGM